MVAEMARKVSAVPENVFLTSSPSTARDCILRMVANKQPIAVDIETTGFNPRQEKLVMVQITQRGKPVLICDMRRTAFHPEWKRAFAPLFTGPLLVGMNFKFDLGWFVSKYGLRALRTYDVMLAEQIIYGVGKTDAVTKKIELNLKAIAARYGVEDVDKAPRDWFIGLDKREEDWNGPFPREILEYGALDVTSLFTIVDQQCAKLKQFDLVRAAQIEFDALPAFAAMEQNGLLIEAQGWLEVMAERELELGVLGESATLVYGQHIMAARIEKFDAEFAEWKAWDAQRRRIEGMLRDHYDAAHEGLWADEYLQHTVEAGETWNDFKLRHMKEWRAEYPNPGKPKLDTSPPNLGSSQQMLDALHRIGVHVTSTQKEFLEPFKDEYEEVDLLLKWRNAAKFLDAFGEKLLARVEEDGRIYGSFAQIGASTGRVAASQPNLQQLPARGEVGQRLRHQFIARPGHRIITCDFPNIELRILADLSGDENMLRAFASGEDLHAFTARFMFNLSKDVDVKHTRLPGLQVTYREVAKTINFGLVYGMSANKLARTIKVSKEQAEELLEKYFELYPGVVEYLRCLRRDVIRGMYKGQSRTATGRVRWYDLPRAPIEPHRDTNGRIHPNRWKEYREKQREYRGLIARIERQAMNTPIQGTSADITKIAMSYFERERRNDWHLLLVVHDEMVTEAPEDSAEECARFVEDCMTRACHKVLSRVAISGIDAVIAGCWSKE